MNPTEIAAWQEWAAPESVMEVVRIGIAAMEDWSTRITSPTERAHLGQYPLIPLLFPLAVAERAANCAVEVAIVVSCWPEPLDAILRRHIRGEV